MDMTDVFSLANPETGEPLIVRRVTFTEVIPDVRVPVERQLSFIEGVLCFSKHRIAMSRRDLLTQLMEVWPLGEKYSGLSR